MKLFLPIFIMLTSVSFALTSSGAEALYQSNKAKLQKVVLDNKQQQTYDEIKKEQEKKHKFYKLDTIEVIEDAMEDECVEVEKINIVGVTLFELEDFEELKKPYLNHCNGIKKLKNLVNKISNMYLNAGYATSRAYLKAQDLSSGIVNINVLEGKIKRIEGKNVYTKNIYVGLEKSILNIRDLEVGITQYERMRHKQVNLELVPSKEVGYTDANIVATTVSKPYFAEINVNHNGSKQTGKYQISSSFSYEDLFGINDIVSLGLNTTNNVFKKTNKSIGYSLSYAFPYARNYFSFSYSDFSFKQQVIDEFNAPIDSKGGNDSFGISYEYKLFHNKEHALDLSFNLVRANNISYLNDVKLELQSYTLSTVNVALKHSYSSEQNSYYSILKVFKGVDILGANKLENQKTDFIKYTLDLSYTRSFLDKLNTKLNTSFHYQYLKHNIYGSQQIGVGGVYSVRGFRDGGLSGFEGGYIRNELSVTKSYKKFLFSPFVGVDFGYVKKDEDVNAGSIAGGVIGSRVSYDKSSIELFYTKALKHTQETKKTDSSFFSLSYSYKF